MTGLDDVNTIRVAIAGCGTVGGALLDLLERHADTTLRRTGVRFEVVRVLVRDLALPRSAAIPRSLLTNSLEDLLDTPADVVVEAIGGVTTAATIARTSLARGRRLVTANKTLLRAEGPALAALACAQRAGFAEADPTRDVTGLDAADKIAVLAWLAWGVDPTTLQVRTVGLPTHVEAAVESARAISLHGRGAGGHATASAMLADVLLAAPHFSHLPSHV